MGGVPIAIGMTSHVHMIIGSKKDKLEDIVRDMKKHTSSELKVAIKNNIQESRKDPIAIGWMLWIACPDASGMERAGKKNGNNKDPIAIGWQFWQQHNKPLEIKSQEMFDEKLAYFHQNPIQAGFVIREEDWKHSSAGDFCGMKGLVSLSYS
jgi:REP element-mobilizing transposase RayT